MVKPTSAELAKSWTTAILAHAKVLTDAADVSHRTSELVRTLEIQLLNASSKAMKR